MPLTNSAPVSQPATPIRITRCRYPGWEPTEQQRHRSSGDLRHQSHRVRYETGTDGLAPPPHDERRGCTTANAANLNANAATLFAESSPGYPPPRVQLHPLTPPASIIVRKLQRHHRRPLLPRPVRPRRHGTPSTDITISPSPAAPCSGTRQPATRGTWTAPASPVTASPPQNQRRRRTGHHHLPRPRRHARRRLLPTPTRQLPTAPGTAKETSKIETRDRTPAIIGMGARQCHIALGRFLSVDPIEADAQTTTAMWSIPSTTLTWRGTACTGPVLGDPGRWFGTEVLTAKGTNYAGSGLYQTEIGRVRS